MTKYERDLIKKLCKDLEKIDLNVANFLGEIPRHNFTELVDLADIHIKECDNVIHELLYRDLNKCEYDEESDIIYSFILRFSQCLRRILFNLSDIEELNFEDMQNELQSMEYYKIYVLLHNHYNF